MEAEERERPCESVVKMAGILAIEEGHRCDSETTDLLLLCDYVKFSKVMGLPPNHPKLQKPPCLKWNLIELELPNAVIHRWIIILPHEKRP